MVSGANGGGVSLSSNSGQSSVSKIYNTASLQQLVFLRFRQSKASLSQLGWVVQM